MSASRPFRVSLRSSLTLMAVAMGLGVACSKKESFSTAAGPVATPKPSITPTAPGGGGSQTNKRKVTRIQGQAGPGGEFKEESQLASNQGLLDLVVVMDNSGSMKTNQSAAAKGLSSLLSEIKNSNWLMQTVTTDADVFGMTAFAGIRYTQPLRASDYAASPSEVEALFNQRMRPGINGSGTEVGIYTAVSALLGEHEVDNGLFHAHTIKKSNWIREGSAVAVLMVSDEDDCSTTSDCTLRGGVKMDASPCEIVDASGAVKTVSWHSGECAVGTFRKLGRTPGTDAKFYSIVQTVAGACGSVENTVGQAYLDATTATKGLSADICTSVDGMGNRDYSTVLKNISKDLSQTLKAIFELKNTPDPGSVHVFVDGKELAPSEFKVGIRTVEILKPLDKNSSLSFKYTIGGKAETWDAIAFEGKAVASSIVVKMKAPGAADFSTVSSDGGVWSYDPNIPGVKFGTVPAAGTTVEVEYTLAP